MTTPLVAARDFGIGPRSDPKIFSCVEKSRGQLVSRVFANAIAASSLAASIPTSAGAFFAHCPRAGNTAACADGVCAVAMRSQQERRTESAEMGSGVSRPSLTDACSCSPDILGVSPWFNPPKNSLGVSVSGLTACCRRQYPGPSKTAFMKSSIDASVYAR